MLTAKTKHRSIRPIGVVLCILFIFSLNLQETVFAAKQGATSIYVRRLFYGWEAESTRFFHLRYAPATLEFKQLLANKADEAVLQVQQILPHKNNRKPWLVIVPEQTIVQQAFGWGAQTSAIGVYAADTIVVLSPQAWEWEDEENRLAAFVKENPLVHEYTHYVLDSRTQGNYQHWFSEGLAQAIEYRIQGYEWLEAGSSLTANRYTLAELDNFNSLQNVPLAYRQSLSIVSFMFALQGDEGINHFIDRLGRGEPFYQALEATYGLTRESLMEKWQNWSAQDSRWSEVKG